MISILIFQNKIFEYYYIGPCYTFQYRTLNIIEISKYGLWIFNQAKLISLWIKIHSNYHLHINLIRYYWAYIIQNIDFF